MVRKAHSPANWGSTTTEISPPEILGIFVYRRIVWKLVGQANMLTNFPRNIGPRESAASSLGAYDYIPLGCHNYRSVSLLFDTMKISRLLLCLKLNSMEWHR